MCADAAGSAADVAALAADSLADGRTVEAARTELVTKVGENISSGCFAHSHHLGHSISFLYSIDCETMKTITAK